MGTTVGWSIWAHPVRRPYVKRLQAQLDVPVDVVWDEVATPSRDPQQRWEVCKRVLRHGAQQGHDYTAWVQDDAIVCRDFTASVAAALDAAGSKIALSPYTGTGRPDQGAARRALYAATTDHHAWLSLRSLYWGVSVVVPTEHVEAIIRIGDRNVFRHSPSDYRVGVALRDHIALRTWYTMPSLADHRDLPSLVGHDKPGQVRAAHYFLGTDKSGLEIDWTAKPHRGIDEHGNLIASVQ